MGYGLNLNSYQAYQRVVELNRDKPSLKKKEAQLFPPNKPVNPYKLTQNCPQGPYFVHKWLLKHKEKVSDTHLLMLSICRRCANMLETDVKMITDSEGNVMASRTVKIVDSQWSQSADTIHNVGYQKQTEDK